MTPGDPDQAPQDQPNGKPAERRKRIRHQIGGALGNNSSVNSPAPPRPTAALGTSSLRLPRSPSPAQPGFPRSRIFQNFADLYRQPTGGFSTVGTIVTIHRCGLRNRSCWTDRTMPKNFDPDSVGLQRNYLFRLFAQRPRPVSSISQR